VSVLEWDISGKYLLVGDLNGSLQIWVPKDNLISEWMALYSITFGGEHIIKAVFFHNGKKNHYAVDKKDQALYSEKFQRHKFSPRYWLLEITLQLI
jgi:mediator of RNA polymerase II transcription subunit 16